MRRLLLVVALTLVLAPQAAAKGPVVLCGADRCVPLLDEGPGLSGLLAVTSQAPAQTSGLLHKIIGFDFPSAESLLGTIFRTDCEKDGIQKLVRCQFLAFGFSQKGFD